MRLGCSTPASIAARTTAWSKSRKGTEVCILRATLRSPVSSTRTASKTSPSPPPMLFSSPSTRSTRYRRGSPRGPVQREVGVIGLVVPKQPVDACRLDDGYALIGNVRHRDLFREHLRPDVVQNFSNRIRVVVERCRHLFVRRGLMACAPGGLAICPKHSHLSVGEIEGE